VTSTQTAQTSEYSSLSSSTQSSLLSGLSQRDQQAFALVFALIDLVLGRDEKDDDSQKLLAGLALMAALNGSGGQTASSYSFESATFSQSTSVQSTGFAGGAGGAIGGGVAASVGGNLNVTA
jgi:hypothetical protein